MRTQVLGGGRLHDHGAHRVGDDVVQLPGDPVAFGAHGRTRHQLLALLEQLLLRREPLHHPPEDVRRDEQRPDEEDVPDVVLPHVEREVLGEERQRDDGHPGQPEQVTAPATQRVHRHGHRQDRRGRVLELPSRASSY